MTNDPMTAASRYTEEELRAIRAHKRRAIEAARDAVRRAGVKLHPKIAAAPAAPDHPEKTCGDCGRTNPVWFAPSELWNTVIGGPYGIICPVCFIARAERNGVVPTAWVVQPDAPTAPERPSGESGWLPAEPAAEWIEAMRAEFLKSLETVSAVDLSEEETGEVKLYGGCTPATNYVTIDINDALEAAYAALARQMERRPTPSGDQP